MVQNGNTNLSHSVSQELYLIWLWFLVHMCKILIPPAIFFFFIFSKFWFSGFSKFINKCQKEILRCAPPSSQVCDFFSVSLSSPKNFMCNIMSLANWQYRYIHTYQIWFQMFHFPIAGYQFTSMSSKLVDMCTSREVESQESNLWNSCQNLL